MRRLLWEADFRASPLGPRGSLAWRLRTRGADHGQGADPDWARADCRGAHLARRRAAGPWAAARGHRRRAGELQVLLSAHDVVDRQRGAEPAALAVQPLVSGGWGQTPFAYVGGLKPSLAERGLTPTTPDCRPPRLLRCALGEDALQGAAMHVEAAGGL